MKVQSVWTSLTFLMVCCASDLRAQTNTFPASGNVGIGTSFPSAQLQVGSSFLGATGALSSILLTNSGTLGTVAGNELTLASFGASTANDSALGVRLLRTATGSDWTTTSIGLAMDVDNTPAAGASLWLSPNGVGIGTASPVMPLDIKGDASGNWLSMNDGSGHTLGTFARSANGLMIGTWSGGGSNLILNPHGNVGIGTTNPAYNLDVAGVARAQQGIVYSDGTKQTTAWTGVLCGGDYAESVDVGGDRTHYEPGDVIVIDPNSPGKFLKSAEPYSTLVSGIYSTKPGVVGRRQLTDRSQVKDEVPMAMTGIVPTKVSAENGAIKTGDLLVASATPGHAMKGTKRGMLTGAVIGKALDNLEAGTGVIEVLVTLQ